MSVYDEVDFKGEYGLDLVPKDMALDVMSVLFENITTHAMKSAAAFRNAALDGMGLFAINPLLDIKDSEHVKFLMDAVRGTIREGRMIDFGFIPNQVLKAECLRARAPFENNELPHPYESWIGVSAWEQGYCGYFFAPYPSEPHKVLAVEIYGIAVPGLPEAILVNDIVAVEVTNGETRISPWDMIAGVDESEEMMRNRGGNVLDPLVTFLRFLSDASIPITNVPAPDRLNKHRVRQGKPAIPAHSRVETQNYVSLMQHHRAGKALPQGGHHSSPVAHWRRAHQRHLASGNIVPVRSSKVNWRDTEELHRLFYKVKPDASH